MEKRRQKSFPFLLTLAILLLFLFSQAIGYFPVLARVPVVVINPGHSVGYDSGAVNGTTGVQEANLNAAVAAKTAERLKAKGYEVYLTHPVADCSIPYLLPNISDANSLKTVGNAINAKNPDLALSIHHNSGGKSASGYEIYWSSYRDFDTEGVKTVSGLWPGDVAFQDDSPCYAAQQSLVFANLVKTAFNGFDIGYRKTVERDDYIPAHTYCPSILFEAGYVSNDSESLLLASESHQNATADRLANAIDAYFGGYSDIEAPTADSITTPEQTTTNAIFTLTANNVIDSGTGVGSVRFAVWTKENDQDDIKWYDGKNNGSGNWSCTVDIDDHGGQTGEYIVHVYATDLAGNDGFIGNTTVNVTKDSNVASGISCVKLSNTMYKIYANGFAGYGNYQFPVWSNNNGQDDIIWYQGIRQTNGSYAAIVDTKNHGYDIGDYTAHVYANDSQGNLTGLGGTSFSVAKMTAEGVTASEVKNESFTVTVSGIQAPNGVRSIQFPVWSDNNGQDDIRWYTATKKSDSLYQVKVDLKDHGYDTGTYSIHCYGTDNNGKLQILGNTNVTVPRMTAESVTA
ncbi:GBS Bsp-like repeat-containing protein, partial [Eubacterium callanderi]|uniref:GBS Bsp-like repeat-containing protein n=1 Tax=Eubacterium callanderi TaxID=53442 RepID=UPI00399B77AE